jgi:hypothetical protein
VVSLLKGWPFFEKLYVYSESGNFDFFFQIIGFSKGTLSLSNRSRNAISLFFIRFVDETIDLVFYW